MKSFVLSLAIISICFAVDDKASGLPAAAAGAVKVYDAEVAKAKAEYDKRDDAAKKILVMALKKVQDSETKSGNLEGALAIKKRIEELAPKGDLLGDRANVIVGEWRSIRDVIIINMDGTAGISKLNPDGTVAVVKIDAKWKAEGGKYILFPEDNSWLDTIALKGKASAEWLRNGKTSVKIDKITDQ